MKIQTPNVFVGFGGDILAKMLDDGFSYSNLVEELQKDSKAGFLFSTENNPNFISLEHQNGLNIPPTFTLKLIDPLGEFEKRFISYNVLDAILDKNATSQMDFLAEQYSLVYEQNNKELIRNSAYTTILKNAMEKGVLRKIHISYGLGQNISDWAGPFEVHLMNGTIEFDGARILTLVFSPTNANMNSNEIIDSKGDKAKGNPTQKKVQILGYSNDLQMRLDINGNPRNINYHDILTETLVDYVKKATQVDNVIVLLPDINVVCKNFINSIIDQETYSVKDNKVLKAAGIGGNLSKSTFDSILSRSSEVNTMTNIKIIKRIFAELGLELVYSDNAFENIITGQVSSDKDKNIDLNTKKAIKDLYDSRSIYLRASSDNRSYEDCNNYLKQIFDNINKKIDDYSQIQYESRTEANSKYLKYWRTLGENSKRIFIREYTAGNYNFSNNEVTIVGDRILISKVLYPSNKTVFVDPCYPLSPEDAEILLNNAYIQKMLKLYKFSGSDAFKLYYIPDDFALRYSSDPEQFKKDLKDANFPVFRYNTQNSNIESLVFNESTSYFTLLNNVAAKYITTKASKSIAEKDLQILKLKKIKNRDELLYYIKTTLSLLDNTSINAEELFKYLDPSFISPNDISVEQFKNLIEAWAKELQKNINILPQIPLDQFILADENIIYMDLLRQISELAFQVEITTLPYFALSNISNLNKSCLLLCQTSDIIQTNKKLPKRINTLGTGVYVLGRFRHIITGDDCKSLFTLMKLNMLESASDNLPSNLK